MVEPKRNVYVGHRYVPLITGEWNQEQDYEGLSITTYQGTSYTSKKRVPVGIDILNEDYWVVTGNYNAQVDQYRQDVRNVQEDILVVKDDIGTVKTGLNATKEDMGFYDITGDGVTNNKAVLQQVIDSNNDVYIKLPIGKVVSSVLTIPIDKNITISGSGKELTEFHTTEQFIRSVSVEKHSTSILHDIKKGDNRITLTSIGNVEVGDLIAINSSEEMEETSRPSLKFHTGIVKTITGNVITISEPFANSFSSSFGMTARIFKVGKITFEDMTVTGQYNGWFADIQYTSGLRFNRVDFKNRYGGKQGLIEGGSIGLAGGDMQGVRLRNCHDTKFTDCNFDSLAYGVMPTDGSIKTEMVGSTASRCRHLSAPTGGAHLTKMIDCFAYDCYAGFDSHQTAYHTEHIGCKAYNNEMAVKLRGRSDTAINCYFDKGLEMFTDNNVAEDKIAENVKVDGHLRFMGKKSILTNVESTNLVTIIGTDLLKVDGLTITIKDIEGLTTELPEQGQDFIITFYPSKNISYKNVNLIGPKAGISQGGGEKTAKNLKAFSFIKPGKIQSVELSNVFIDGFDVGLNMPVAYDLERYSFNNVVIANSVEGIFTSQNYKDNVDIKKVYFDNCLTTISDPSRLRMKV